MASISTGAAFAVVLTALAGGLDKPHANWTEVDIQMPATQHAYRLLNQQGYLSSDRADGSARITPSGSRGKISPQDFFRIVEIAPKAIGSPGALNEPPAGADALLRIKTSDGKNYYFVGEQGHFKDGNAQEIWTILRKYRSDAW